MTIFKSHSCVTTIFIWTGGTTDWNLTHWFSPPLIKFSVRRQGFEPIHYFYLLRSPAHTLPYDRTRRISALNFQNNLSALCGASLVPQKGLKPLTHGLEGRCSVQLSYWGKLIGPHIFTIKLQMIKICKSFLIIFKNIW